MNSIEKLFSDSPPLSLRLPSGVAGGTPVYSITDNSRDVSAGSLFFAVRGTKVDAHAFVPEVLSRGAIPVVDREDVFREIPYGVLVPDVRRAYGYACSRWFDEPTRDLRGVGVTGTNGKTTVTYLLSELWEQLDLSTGVIGTVEIKIGDRRSAATMTTPDPYVVQGLFREMCNRRIDRAAVEVTSIALDQYRLAGSHFEVGLFTNLTRDHLDYHGDFENYYLAKKKFFDEFSLAAAVINIDDPWGRRLLKELPHLKSFRFSTQDPSADFFAGHLQTGVGGTQGKLKTPQGEFNFSLGLIGLHNVYNLLGSLAALHAMEHDLTRVIPQLPRLIGAPGRLERVDVGENGPSVFVDYAHTPDALENVLSSLEKIRPAIHSGKGARIITVFGCGGDRDRTKRPVMGEIASRLSEVVVVTSDNPRTEDPQTIVDEISTGIRPNHPDIHRQVSRRDAIHLALTFSKKNDIVLIAGKGHETYQILGKDQIPFDDREVVREYYNRNKG